MAIPSQSFAGKLWITSKPKRRLACRSFCVGRCRD